VSFLGAAESSPLPMPSYPRLRPYIDSVKDLLARYDTLAFNPRKAAEILSRKGWQRGASGFWVDAQGAPPRLEIISFGTLGPAVGPVIAEQSRRQGIDATFSLPADFEDRFQKGFYTAALYGHGGSVDDPYHTLRLYQSASVAVPGGHSPPHEHDVLAELAHPGPPVRQRRFLAPDLRHRALALAAHAVSRVTPRACPS
jgi:hypothetical protein